MKIDVEITETVFFPYDRLARFDEASGDAGATAAFVGRCRHGIGAALVKALELQHYPGFTERIVREHAIAIAAAHKLIDALIIHRAGFVAPGEAIVLVAARALGRAAAQAAVEQLMDHLKTDAPFWKREHYRAGAPRWVDPTETDRERRKRWS